MTVCNWSIKIAFLLFLLYTAVHIILWLLGLCASINRLSKSEELKAQTRIGISNSLAAKYPVSIIIPAHNEEECIISTIESLLNEEYPYLKIILIDDGSTDQTAEKVIRHYRLEHKEIPFSEAMHTEPVLEYYEQPGEDGRICLACKESGGKADALNCGLNLCDCPYCVILDADTKIEKGSIRMMISQFITDKRTVVCAGAVGTYRQLYQEMSFLKKALVFFQILEYDRTFYMQRILMDRINANIVVSGAFAMFDVDILKKIGGYRVNTIGEDMEITLRLHAFCSSQGREYKISYVPEAKCCTQFPFRYRDYFRQRRRWQIGMIQSVMQHRYMCGNRFYGWIGILFGTLYLFYELLAPCIELFGLITVIAAYGMGILHSTFVFKALLIYLGLVLLTQMILIQIIQVYRIKKIDCRMYAAILLVSVAEFLFFHVFNMCIKLIAFFTYSKNKKHWGRIRRAKDIRNSEEIKAN